MLDYSRTSPICFKCGKTPEQIGEYKSYAAEEGISEDEFVVLNEGTYNVESHQFCCTECYINIGMPSSRFGWKAP